MTFKNHELCILFCNRHRHSIKSASGVKRASHEQHFPAPYRYSVLRKGGRSRVEALNMSDLILSRRTRRPLSRALLCNTYKHFEPSCATGFRSWAINKCSVRRAGTRTLRQPLDEEAVRDLPSGLACLHPSPCRFVWIFGDFAAFVMI